jgi:hypothetical protein
MRTSRRTTGRALRFIGPFAVIAILLIWGELTIAVAIPRGTRSVDFRNFTYELESLGPGIRLKDGSFRLKNDVGGAYVEFKSVSYAHLKKSGKEQAVVTILTRQGGSMPVEADCFVFEYRDGRVQAIFHQWREGRPAVCVRDSRLIIAAASWLPADAHCCPSLTEWKTYRWNGSAFVVASRKTHKEYPFQRRAQIGCKCPKNRRR